MLVVQKKCSISVVQNKTQFFFYKSVKQIAQVLG